MELTEPAKLERLLLDLGDTPDAIAAYLEGQGCVGFMQSPSHCPVSLYLHRNGFPRARVLNSLVITDIDGTRVFFPRAVREFVRRFDLGEYGGLTRPMVLTDAQIKRLLALLP